ncbi:MAG: DUF563 domain-containing protein [Salinibacter sp.]|uniref:DUF563 domain-containing protein n=1 Tax=Salinibacter sp. TaxID=2065818 RepID=UPI0035D4FFB3
MISDVRRFIYRHFADVRVLKRLVGPRIVEALKRMVNAESLVTAEPFDEVFPEATSNTIREEKGIPYGDIRNLNVRSENRIDEQEGVYRRPPVFTSTVDDALICPTNNVVMNRDREVAEASINMRGRTELGLDRQALCRSQLDAIDGYATLLRGPAIGYWHAQLDSLPRLSLLRRDEYRSLPTIKLLRPEGGPAVNEELEDFLVPRIAPPNCEIVEVPPDRLYSVENYIFASFLTFPFSAYLPGFYLDLLREHVCPDRERRRSERIFISRKKASRRKVLNEDELSSRLGDRGFDTYHLEDLHTSEKVELFYDAEIVVSPTSSGLASLLYTRDIPVVELFPMPEIVHPANYFLSLSLGNDHHYVPHDGDSLTSDFWADVEETVDKVDALLSARSRVLP